MFKNVNYLNLIIGIILLLFLIITLVIRKEWNTHGNLYYLTYKGNVVIDTTENTLYYYDNTYYLDNEELSKLAILSKYYKIKIINNHFKTNKNEKNEK